MKIAHILTAVLVAVIFRDASAILLRTCEHGGGVLNITCGGVIRINSANYGRTAGMEVCPPMGRYTGDCIEGNSLNIVKAECEGKKFCSVLASNSVFGDPCVGTRKYLEVDYYCAQPTSQTQHACEHGDGPLRLSCSEPGRVLHIFNAMYGRRLPLRDTCPNNGRADSTTCQASSSLSRVRRACQGKRSCSVDPANRVFGDPCRRVEKYLEVQYMCAERARVCEHGELQLKCRFRQKIYVQDAFYGRQEGAAICPHSRIESTDCREADSLGMVRSFCEGRSSCTLSATNSVFGDPCPGTFKYLEVLYVCHH